MNKHIIGIVTGAIFLILGILMTNLIYGVTQMVSVSNQSPIDSSTTIRLIQGVFLIAGVGLMAFSIVPVFRAVSEAANTSGV